MGELGTEGSARTSWMASLLAHDDEQLGGLRDEAHPDSRNRSRIHAMTFNGTGVDMGNSSATMRRRGDIHYNGLIVAVIGMTICRHEFQMQKRLFTFARAIEGHGMNSR